MPRFSIKKEKEEFESKLIDLARTARIMAGGRRFSFRAVVIMGNRKGKVGVGVGKGQDVSIAIEKANRDGKRNVINVPIINNTIPYQSEAKYKSAKVLLKPRREGGIIAGGPLRVICEFSGIPNITGKIIGKTKNKLSNARAAILALKKIKS